MTVNDGFDKAAVNHPERETLQVEQIGDVGQAILTLTRELWVVKDRLRILEVVLEAKGIDVTEAIDSFQPDEALASELAREGQALAARIVECLSGVIGLPASVSAHR